MTLQQDREQLFLELLNRARMDPAAEAVLQKVADLSAGTGEIITTAPKQVLAFNAALLQSATAHNQDMINANFFDHAGSNGSQVDGRMSLANYHNSTFGYGENLANIVWSGVQDVNALVNTLHGNLFRSDSHRSNILESAFEEVGVSALTDTNYMGWANAFLTTHNFGVRYNAGVFVTGVHYTDTDNNNFYSIGESAAGRTAQLWKNGLALGAAATTANAGGYQIQTAANGGAVEMVYSGGGLASEQGASFTIGATNIKIDLTDNNTIETNVSATLTRNAVNLTLLSIDNVSGTGNGLHNIIKGNKGNNTLDGAGGNDILQGGDGNDTLKGGAGNDTLNGEGGAADIAVFTSTMASNVITLAGGTYTVYGADGSVDTVTGVENFQFSDGVRTLAQLTLAGGPPVRAATISGGPASQAEGNAGTVVYTYTVTLNAASHATQTLNFTIAGSGTFAANAADFTGALAGTLTFLSGETSKIINVSVNGDTASEEAESFTVTLSGQSAGLSLATATATSSILNDDVAGPNVINGTTLANTLTGTAGIDHINGIDGNDVLRGLGGADVLDGGVGLDTADYSASLALVNINLLTNVNSGGDAAGDSLLNIENVTGSSYADVITGSDLANTLTGGLGSDQIYGGIGNDVIAGGIGADQMDGGVGTDTVSYSTSTTGVTVNLTTNVNTGGDAAGDSLLNFEYVTGSAYIDNLTGNILANILTGGGGFDILNGGDGNDNLAGGSGADQMDGGVGTDTASYSTSTAGVTVNLTTNVNTGGDAAGDSLLNFENITGSAHIDSLTGNTLANALTGGGGNDILNGGDGNDALTGGAGADQINGGNGTLDIAYYSASTAAVTINLNSGINTGGDAQGDTLSGIERVHGSIHDDSITGDNQSNTLYGYNGADLLNGMTGNDTLYGGSGNDKFFFSALNGGNDTIADYVDSADKIQFASALAANFGELVLSGQGTTTVTVSGFDGTAQIIVKSTTAFNLDMGDFIFVV